MDAPARLPPLGMLRVFEAAARLGSFSAAAQELNVTHSAVSHQIRALEEQLGFALFHREGRGVQLTLVGLELAARVNRALCEIGSTVALLRQRANPRRLTVTTMPSFAARWLAPRLGSFLEQEPDIELNIVTTSTVLDFARDGIDIAIRFGFGEAPGQQVELLMRDEMLVVASPQLLGDSPPAVPEDLRDRPLLRSDGEFWRGWFECVGLDWSEPQGGLYFNDSAIVLQAALDGRGFALSRRSLCQQELDAGRLVQVFPQTLPNTRAYWFVSPAGVALTPLAQRFRAWIFEEASRCPPVAEDAGSAARVNVTALERCVH
ncbi:transcriptional regulator GcvA [Uliginosibacterium sp. 31-16]|uniref:transcriptional regulator GcvA n=1 Tax=Uliginosibacterium sp. 31-16 TaxID=3068315 RepID=UPI00273D93DD|nr:transcriptional regulator GcvA [Uliginosibacterium sp. 31-16]MDP5239847.1 transcriptional regulator GcvA [Uliginosibacterium sp. 31-16]